MPRFDPQHKEKRLSISYVESVLEHRVDCTLHDPRALVTIPRGFLVVAVFDFDVRHYSSYLYSKNQVHFHARNREFTGTSDRTLCLEDIGSCSTHVDSDIFRPVDTCEVY